LKAMCNKRVHSTTTRPSRSHCLKCHKQTDHMHTMDRNRRRKKAYTQNNSAGGSTTHLTPWCILKPTHHWAAPHRGRSVLFTIGLILTRSPEACLNEFSWPTLYNLHDAFPQSPAVFVVLEMCSTQHEIYERTGLVR